MLLMDCCLFYVQYVMHGHDENTLMLNKIGSSCNRKSTVRKDVKNRIPLETEGLLNKNRNVAG